jgi:uncharacterized membrane protein YbhN (UPF0104 family)
VLFALGFGAAIAVIVLITGPSSHDLVVIWDHLRAGNVWWLAGAAAFEAVSFVGYISLFHTVIGAGERRIGWALSTEVTLAGVAATRVLAAAGAGGMALTTWALHAVGMDAHTIARRLIALLVLSYSVFCATLLIVSALLAAGVAGDAPTWLTLLGLVAGGGGLLVISAGTLVPLLRRRLSALASRGGRWQRRLRTIREDGLEGAHHAAVLLRRRDPRLVGAIVYWGGDVAALWALLHAFGADPEVTTPIAAYFIGQLANLLPIPGGIGAIEGGITGAMIALGISPATAVATALAYSAISLWLPVLPGLVAYFALRHRLSRAGRERAGVAADHGETGHHRDPIGR